MVKLSPRRTPRVEIAPPGVIIISGEDLQGRAEITRDQDRSARLPIASPSVEQAQQRMGNKAARRPRSEIAPPGVIIIIIISGEDLQGRAEITRDQD